MNLVSCFDLQYIAPCLMLVFFPRCSTTRMLRKCYANNYTVANQTYFWRIVFGRNFRQQIAKVKQNVRVVSRDPLFRRFDIVSASFRLIGNRTGCPLLAVLFCTYDLRQLVLRQLSREKNSAIFLFYYSFMTEPQPLRDGKRVVGGFHKVVPIKKFFKVCGYKDSGFEEEGRLSQLSHWKYILVIIQWRRTLRYTIIVLLLFNYCFTIILVYYEPKYAMLMYYMLKTKNKRW